MREGCFSEVTWLYGLSAAGGIVWPWTMLPPKNECSPETVRLGWGGAGTCVSHRGWEPGDIQECVHSYKSTASYQYSKVQRCLFRAGANFLPSHIWQTPAGLTAGGAVVELPGMRALCHFNPRPKDTSLSGI